MRGAQCGRDRVSSKVHATAGFSARCLLYAFHRSVLINGRLSLSQATVPGDRASDLVPYCLDMHCLRNPALPLVQPTLGFT